MAYQQHEELNHLPKSEAKQLYKKAYSRLIETERGEFFQLWLRVAAGHTLGTTLGSYFYNSTHLFLVTGLIGGCIGYFFMKKRLKQKIKPHLSHVVKESSV